MNLAYRLFNSLILCFILIHSVQRDIKLESHSPCDLRNRVIGARFEKDGKLPYAYAWKPSDGMRYYDPHNPNNGSGPSNITASPFFHQLLWPIAEWPQRTISRFWLLLSYLMLAGMILMTCGMTSKPGLRWLIVNTGILFTLTHSWQGQINTGQLYLFEGFLISLVLFALSRNKKASIVFAGAVAVVFILTRPIGIVLFIPFLVYYKKNLLFLSTAFTALGIYGLLTISSPYQRDLYRDYVKNMKEHVLGHQRLHTPVPFSFYYLHRPFNDLEGFDLQKSEELEEKDHIILSSESMNFFVLYALVIHSPIPLDILNTTTVLAILVISVLFFFRTRGHPIGILQLACFGFTLYIIMEWFSPIYRHPYNLTEWLPLLLTGILLSRSWKSWTALLIFFGLLLNISNTSWIPMRLSIGELCWMGALLGISFSPGINIRT